ncbi:MAG: membrane-bound PQQ-dependent dehydrogenase, glucose/quinate/shikimate family [Gammaproteobacteria bacterium]|nr:membrane-bound PQQ-dependent dehydrogenase, glucose/quinate/shikimate family [Gammaproteobacteria bacterium]MBT3860184.1 membrane-bound PQQ-dependent dehydrogenase, glucose/quinate/shikimate family [Gammaproteobacteria bacterium]MBT3987476.1 membrane-bound PQQ-dependent dehydrogenase, glucose/quinate/shikimate family [Gammaproteobacteria bacterium]MBT4581786.1 membrane-bound PQQ-dependent dehydrogenase, glucose/quinate/shikimate family [Gammaproteobacteria bacterium]MBT4659646.1 membrane-bou
MSESSRSYPKPRFLSVVIGLIGVLLVLQGLPLIQAGGSFYYLLAGITLVAVSVLLFRGDDRGAKLYGIFLAITYLWALYEAGLDAWALMPRVAMFTVLGLWFVIPRVRRGLQQAEPLPLLDQLPAKMVLSASTILAIALLLTSGSYDVGTPSAAGTGQANNPSGEWRNYGSSKTGTRFAAADQINVDNVAQLEKAWEIRTGVPGEFKGTPIQVGDGLYLCTGQNIILSLDPDTGEERWRFDPDLQSPKIGFWDTCRGVTYYDVPDSNPSADCAERIFTATTDARLIAVDKETGRPCSDFGVNGEISLLAGMGEVIPGFYFVTSPPTISNDVLVLGGWVLDNQMTEEPSGVVRGFNPLTGELVWAWDMGREDRSGLPPEGDNYTRGTPNVWSLTSADEELGLIYVPTGNGTPDYFGGHRSEAMDQYASSIVALDAATGRVRWSFQTTHHDIWDYDVPSQPTLVDIPVNGVVRKAVIVPTKRAEIFLLDRETGEPITEVAEIATPQTDIPEEYTVPTQPFSVGMPSFGRETLTEADMWGITPFDHAACRLQFKRMRYEGPLTPPTTGYGSLYYPGVAGGMNWGSVAVDEVNHLMVVNTMHNPSVVRLIPRDEVTDSTQFGIGGAQSGTPYGVYSFFFLSPIFAPCLKPPYGELAVVDLASQEILWRRPFGTAKEQGPLGIPSGLPLQMGMFYNAGSAVTGGGLIFNGGVVDSTFRAVDLFTGEEVWTDSLPGSSTATPMSYVSPATGKQYVIVTVPDGGGGLSLEAAVDDGTDDEEAPGGYVMAYSLPD